MKLLENYSGEPSEGNVIKLSSVKSPRERKVQSAKKRENISADKGVRASECPSWPTQLSIRQLIRNWRQGLGAGGSRFLEASRPYISSYVYVQQCLVPPSFRGSWLLRFKYFPIVML